MGAFVSQLESPLMVDFRRSDGDGRPASGGKNAGRHGAARRSSLGPEDAGPSRQDAELLVGLKLSAAAADDAPAQRKV